MEYPVEYIIPSDIILEYIRLAPGRVGAGSGI